MPTYDNAWLAAREQRRSPGPEWTWDPSVGGYVRNTQMRDPRAAVAQPEDPVAAAKAALASADALSARHDTSNLANIPARLADLAAEQEAGRPSLRALTRPLATAGQAAQVASLPALMAGPAPAAALGVGGTLAQVPDMLVRGLEDPQDAPGMVEGGMALLGLAPGVGGAQKVGRAAQMASRFPRVMGGPNVSKAVPYANTVPSSNPNQVLGVAREIAGETGDPLRKVLAGGRQNRYNRASQEALMKLATSGRRNQPQRQMGFMDEAIATGRTVPTSTAMRQQAAEQGDAWTALRELALRHEGTPTSGANLHRSIDDFVAAEAGPVTDLSDVLGSQTGARVRARARAFRRNSPLPEGF